MLEIFVDADGCSVKSEIFRVAERYQMKVFVVANSAMNIPLNSQIEMVLVHGGFDAADDWIAENCGKGDIVVTTDILLAQRCLLKSAFVLGPKGNEFNEDNIGQAVATRELMQNLRHMGENRGGPAPMEKKDRSQFLGKLDQIIHRARKLREP